MKRLLTMCTVAVLAVASLAIAASAKEPTGVRINQNDRELRKGRTLRLSVSIRPSDADEQTGVWFESEDPEVCEVDKDGVVTALESGYATIVVYTDNGKTDKINITVPGKNVPSEEYQESESSVSSRSSSANKEEAAGATADLTEKLNRESLVAAVKNAVSGRASFSNYASVSTDSLRAAADAGGATVNFDTKVGGSVVGRVAITPASAKELTGDINLGVYANTAKTRAVQNTFAKYYKNKVTVIRCDQSDFGMNVELVAKVGALKADGLRFYSYNSKDNKYADLTVSNVTVDKNGYVHFTTAKGGYIIVSQGALAK